MLPLFHVELNKMFKKKFMKIIYSGNLKKTFDLIKNSMPSLKLKNMILSNYRASLKTNFFSLDLQKLSM